MGSILFPSCKLSKYVHKFLLWITKELHNCGHARIRGLLFRYAAQVNYYQKVKTEGKVVKDKEEEDSLTSSKQIATTMIVLH